jgi:hypothetical protein
MGVQEVRWEAGEYTFFCGKGNENYELCTGFFVDSRIMSAVKGGKFISDRMSYIILRGFGAKDSFYEGLESVSDKFT